MGLFVGALQGEIHRKYLEPAGAKALSNRPFTFLGDAWCDPESGRITIATGEKLDQHKCCYRCAARRQRLDGPVTVTGSC